MKYIRNFMTMIKYYNEHIALLASRLDALKREMEQATHFIKKATKLHVDIGAMDDRLSTTIILCGQYRGKDHVQTFRLPPGSMIELIDQLRHMQRASTIQSIDAPLGMNATIRRELK